MSHACVYGHTCVGKLKLLAWLRFLLFPVPLLDALPAEFRLLLRFAVGLAASAVDEKGVMHKHTTPKLLHSMETAHIFTLKINEERRILLYAIVC